MKKLMILAVTAVMATTGAARAADTFASQPVRILVPYAPGGASDNVARQLAVGLAEQLGTSVVVENRPGAAGNIAIEAAARAKPDGHTLVMGNVSTNAINPWVYASRLSSNPRTDLVAVSQVASIPHLIVGAPSFAPNDMAGLVSYAKQNPGVVNYASAGTGTYSMIDMERIAEKADIEMVHIPYDGGAGPMMTALMGDQIHLCFVNASSALELVRAGKIKALAVTWPDRLDELPDVQTMAEAGFEGIGTNAWQGLFAPAGTPREVIERLHAAVTEALKRDDVRRAYAKMLVFPTPSATPEEFAEVVERDAAHWGEIVRRFDIKLD